MDGLRNEKAALERQAKSLQALVQAFSSIQGPKLTNPPKALSFAPSRADLEPASATSQNGPSEAIVCTWKESGPEHLDGIVVVTPFSSGTVEPADEITKENTVHLVCRNAGETFCEVRVNLLCWKKTGVGRITATCSARTLEVYVDEEYVATCRGEVLGNMSRFDWTGTKPNATNIKLRFLSLRNKEECIVARIQVEYMASSSSNEEPNYHNKIANTVEKLAQQMQQQFRHLESKVNMLQQRLDMVTLEVRAEARHRSIVNERLDRLERANNSTD